MFIDMVDSSLFSRVMKLENYGDTLVKFHEILKLTYSKFVDSFGKASLKRWFNLNEFQARGDEGFICFTTDKPSEVSPLDIIYAIKLALHIKFDWLLANLEKDLKEHIDLAIGINQGTVLGNFNENSELTGIEGYEINFTKRVESYSRNGRYTNIFLSEKARNIIQNVNVVLEKNKNCDLKGIGERVNLYEVSDFIFYDLDYILTDVLLEPIKIIEENIIPFYEKPWLENFLISIYISEAKRTGLASKYIQKASYIIDNSNFKDNIYYRYFKAYFLDDTLPLKIKYFQEILKENPRFLPARIDLIKLYKYHSSRMRKFDAFSLEIKNYIDEILSYYKDVFDEKEVEDFRNILKKINSLK